MKKIMGLLAVIFGLYYGIIQVRLESPAFQSNLDSFLADLGTYFKFTVGESVDQPYNYITSHAPAVAENVKHNFMPYCTVGLFLTTVAILRKRGKNYREAIRTAAFPATATPAVAEVSPAVKKAQARTLRAQLISDQISLENKLRKLPEQIVSAEKGVSYTRKHLIEATTVYKKAQADHYTAENHLANLQTIKASLETDLAQITTEIENVTKEI